MLEDTAASESDRGGGRCSLAEHLQEAPAGAAAPSQNFTPPFPPHKPGSGARVRHHASFLRRGQQGRSWLGTPRPMLRARSKSSGLQMGARPLTSFLLSTTLNRTPHLFGPPFPHQKSEVLDQIGGPQSAAPLSRVQGPRPSFRVLGE